VDAEKIEAVEQLIIDGGPMGKAVTVQKLKLNKIKLGKNSRLSISKEELSGLMQSIKELGLLQPIGVVKNGDGYEVCYGNRRFMACSKLGFTNIPAIVHEKKKESDIDLKNLTENIQRRNISLSEAGRYLELLLAGGLSESEAAVRMGVAKSYVRSALAAYREVPTKYRKDLEINVSGGRPKKTPGKITVSVANAISNARRRCRLTAEETEKLFDLAKDEKFQIENTQHYALALKEGKKNPLLVVDKLKYISVRFAITQDEHDRLMRDFVIDGPFQSINGLIRAILEGKKSVKISLGRQV
jgi:ParB/RepB/Spo0J family partition protein